MGLSRCSSIKNFELLAYIATELWPILEYLVWYGYIWFGLVLKGMVHGYYLDVVPCKISSSYLEKQQSYGQFKDIWFGLVRLGLVWFGFERYGAWVLSRCSSMLNFELLA